MLNKLKNFICYALVVAIALPCATLLGIINPQKAHAGSDITAPTSFITYPSSAYYNSLSQITGTANDDIDGTGIKKVELEIKDNTTNKYFDGTSWVSNACVEATGADNWTYSLDNSYLTTNTSYTISSKAIDNADNEQTIPTTVTFMYDTTKPNSAINAHNAYYKSLNPIYGTATDNVDGSGIKNVKVEIKNNTTAKYFNGTTWQDASIWLLATGTTSWNYVSNNAYLVNDNNYTVSSKATDNADNEQTTPTTVSFTFDNVAPTGTFVINNGATVTNSQNVDLKFSGFSIDTKNLMISNNSDMSNSTAYGCPLANNPINWNLSDGQGEKTVYVKLFDRAGNETDLQQTINYDQNANNAETYPVTANPNEQQITSTDNPELNLSFTALQDTTLTIDTYKNDPSNGQSLPHFLNPFNNKYYEISYSPHDVAFDQVFANGKVKIKIYYTQADLDNAGITENQLVGIYYYDGNWQTYTTGDAGVNTNDVPGTNYLGYVWVEATHFTPMTIGYDKPVKPSNFTSEAKDGSVNLSWTKVDNAKGYWVRYREATSTDNTDYKTVYLADGNATSTTVSGLNNGTLYEFGIASVTQYNNTSDYAVVVNSPKASAVTNNSTISYASYQAVSQDQVSENTDQNLIQNDGEQTVTVEGGQVKSEQSTNNNRLWTIIGIILIVAGAAYAGYYGYEWWMEKPKATVKTKTPTPTVKTPKTPKNNQKAGRW